MALLEYTHSESSRRPRQQQNQCRFLLCRFGTTRTRHIFQSWTSTQEEKDLRIYTHAFHFQGRTRYDHSKVALLGGSNGTPRSSAISSPRCGTVACSMSRAFGSKGHDCVARSIPTNKYYYHGRGRRRGFECLYSGSGRSSRLGSAPDQSAILQHQGTTYRQGSPGN